MLFRSVKKRDGNETGFYLEGYAYRGTIDSERELEEVKDVYKRQPFPRAESQISLSPL